MRTGEYPHAIDVFRRLDGLEALQMMQRGDVPKTNVNVWMNFTVETVERGHVVFAMMPDEKLYNMIGSVHGGIITTLMDTALGSAVQSVLAAGRVATTMDLQTRFHRPVTAATGKVYADARVVHAGRRTRDVRGASRRREGHDLRDRHVDVDDPRRRASVIATVRATTVCG